MGDSGTIGDELLQGVSELEHKCFAVYLSVKDDDFTFEEALEAYGITPAEYIVYCLLSTKLKND